MGAHADIVYVMVMNGAQAHDVVMGDDGLARTMAKGGIIILTATIKPSEVRALATAMKDTGQRVDDSLFLAFRARKMVH